jgi:hypothetical protein
MRQNANVPLNWADKICSTPKIMVIIIIERYLQYSINYILVFKVFFVGDIVGW